MTSSDLSNITINGEPQTWQQLYEREKAERQRADEFRRLVADLSRCEHGRGGSENRGGGAGGSSFWMRSP